MIFRLLSIIFVPLYSGLAIFPDFESVALQARAHVIRLKELRGAELRFLEKMTPVARKDLLKRTVGALSPSVLDLSLCSSLAGPRCALLGRPDKLDTIRSQGIQVVCQSFDHPAELDGVLFAEQALSEWNILYSGEN